MSEPVPWPGVAERVRGMVALPSLSPPFPARPALETPQIQTCWQPQVRRGAGMVQTVRQELPGPKRLEAARCEPSSGFKGRSELRRTRPPGSGAGTARALPAPSL